MNTNTYSNQWHVTSDLGPSGSSIRHNVPDLDLATATRLFGQAPRYAYWDPESGYDGYEWGFTCGEDHVTLYFRWGLARVRGRSSWAALRFQAWLDDRLAQSTQPGSAIRQPDISTVTGSASS